MGHQSHLSWSHIQARWMPTLQNLSSHTMEDVLVPWGGRVKFPVFEFWAMFQSLIDDPRLHKELLIDWNNPSSIPSNDKDYLDEIHSMEWYHETYKFCNIQDSTFVVLCGLIFFLDCTHIARNDCQGTECLFFTLSIIPWKSTNRSWSWHALGIMPKIWGKWFQRTECHWIPLCPFCPTTGCARGPFTWGSHHRCLGTWWPSTNP